MRISNRFAASCVASTSKVSPVTLAPGVAMLATSPAATGSTPTVMTIGMVVVAFLAARVAGLVDVTITSTPERTRSVASSGRRPMCGPAFRLTKRTFRPAR